MASYGCNNCTRHFRSQNAIESHCYAKGHGWTPKWYCSLCERFFVTERRYEQHCMDAAAHRTCNICDLVFRTVDVYERHYSRKHCPKKQCRVNCNFCDRSFNSPSAYAQHIESGIHGVSGHQVTQAVQMLRIVPKITIAPQTTYTTTSRIEPFEYNNDAVAATADVDTIDNALAALNFNVTTDAHEAQPLDAVDPAEAGVAVPGPPLGPREMAVATLPCPPVVAGTYQYVPDNFVDLGIPYACPICLKTFRNAFALTAHMNSPVHDPDAFLCPKCNREFRLISGLIQHLESWCCKLASPSEIYTRFAKLTARFSRLLT